MSSYLEIGLFLVIIMLLDLTKSRTMHSFNAHVIYKAIHTSNDIDNIDLQFISFNAIYSKDGLSEFE